jgi:uncharacterized protein
MTMDRKWLDFDFDVKAVQNESGIIEGYASVFGNVDSYGDIVAKGAFRKTLRERLPKGIPVLWQHDAAQPIGLTTDAEETDKGLMVRASLNLDKQVARDAYSDVQHGIVKGLSIGFTTVKDSVDRTNGVRTLNEVKLFEWSLVTFPANESASVTRIKGVDELMAEVERGDLTAEQLKTVAQRILALAGNEPGNANEPESVTEPTHSAEPPATIEPEILHSFGDLIRQFNREWRLEQ